MSMSLIKIEEWVAVFFHPVSHYVPQHLISDTVGNYNHLLDRKYHRNKCMLVPSVRALIKIVRILAKLIYLPLNHSNISRIPLYVQ